MTHDRQRKCADSNIMHAGSVLYSCFVLLQYYINNYLDLCITCTIKCCYQSSVNDVVPQGYRVWVFLTYSVVLTGLLP